MYKLSEKEIISNEGLLDGTIINHSCDPQMDCPECKGDGRCTKCHGTGKTTCMECRGKGKTRCNNCGGTGTCRRCGGTGLIRCPECHGEGRVWKNNDLVKCKKCNGRGECSCPDCTSPELKVTKGLSRVATLGMINLGGIVRGSGKCNECGGSGELECENCEGTGLVTCTHCDGSGNCPKCGGSGKVKCTRCNGSGWYQTYSTYKATCKEIRWNYFSSGSIVDALKTADGQKIYSGTFKRWQALDKVSFDKTADLEKSIDSAFGNNETYSAFDTDYRSSSENAVIGGKPYSKTVSAYKIPATKIDFMLNDAEYTVYVTGDNHIVLCGDLPKKIAMYKPSLWKKICMLLTYRRRYKAFLKLAAYIFQCDGKTIDESHVLSVFIKDFKVNGKKKQTLRSELEKYNSSMPYEHLRKEIKPLFSSKKALTFAWQCMAVDKRLSSREEELFNRLVKEYTDIQESEINEIKRFADKYALLKDEYLVKEYLR